MYPDKSPFRNRKRKRWREKRLGSTLQAFGVKRSEETLSLISNPTAEVRSAVHTSITHHQPISLEIIQVLRDGGDTAITA